MPNPSSQHWIDKAKEDEQVVTLLVANGGPWTIAAYHVQQAAEKYLKAVLVEQGLLPPQTHSLLQILPLIKSVTIPAEVIDAAAMTSAYAWQTRYPGSHTLEGSELIEATQNLEAIEAWVFSLVW